MRSSFNQGLKVTEIYRLNYLNLEKFIDMNHPEHFTVYLELERLQDDAHIFCTEDQITQIP